MYDQVVFRPNSFGKYCTVFALTFGFLFAATQLVSAQPVNVRAALTEKLAGLGSFPISQSCSQVCAETRQVCVGRSLDGPRICNNLCVRNETRCTDVSGPLRTGGALNVEVVSEKMGEPYKSGIPDNWIVRSTVVDNCSTIQQTASGTLSQQMTQSSQISLARSVSSTTAVQISVGGTFPIAGVGSVNSGASYSISRQIGISETNSSSVSETVSISQNYSAIIKPKEELQVTLSSFLRSFRMPFSATLLIDGPLAQNRTGNTMISDVLSETDRLFTIEGHLDVEIGSEAFLSYKRRAIACDNVEGVNALHGPTETLSGVGIEISDEKLSADVNSILLEALSARVPGMNADLPQALSKGLQNEPKQSPGTKAQNVSASGRHQCQSATSIGHSCQVLGFYTDCNAARVSLSTQDCCFATPDAGTSIGFTLEICR